MPKVYTYITLLTLLLSKNIAAQTADIYIPNKSIVGFFPGDSTAFFGNVKVDGTLLLNTKSFIYFLGNNWTNSNSYNIIDESLGGSSAPGGTVRFSQLSTVPNTQQQIYGAYTAATKTGTYFPNMEIDNPAGVYISDSSDVAIRNTLRFLRGHMLINRSNIVVGSTSQRGNITGFDQRKFIVTGGGLFGGFLYRMQVLPNEPDSTVFPIGSSTGFYTPVSLFSHGEADNYRARVFPKVYEHGLFGPDVSDQTTNKTWIVANELPVFNASIRFQHIIEEEGTAFHAARSNAYVSHLVSGRWDTTGIYNRPKSPGTITTGTPSNNSGMLTRTIRFGQPDSYLFAEFVKSTGVDNPVGYVLFTARRISPFLALLNLTVDNDNNVAYYEIQKRRLNVNDWSPVDTLLPTNTPGRHTYAWNDNDVYYPDIIQYRIRIVHPDGTYTYTVIRNIEGISQEFYVQVFPNPGYGEFYLRIVNAPDVEFMAVYDNYGQFLMQKRVTSPLTSFNLGNYPQGTYHVVLYGKARRKIFSEKVIKLNR